MADETEVPQSEVVETEAVSEISPTTTPVAAPGRWKNWCKSCGRKFRKASALHAHIAQSGHEIGATSEPSPKAKASPVPERKEAAPTAPARKPGKLGKIFFNL